MTLAPVPDRSTGGSGRTGCWARLLGVVFLVPLRLVRRAPRDPAAAVLAAGGLFVLGGLQGAGRLVDGGQRPGRAGLCRARAADDPPGPGVRAAGRAGLDRARRLGRAGRARPCPAPGAAARLALVGPDLSADPAGRAGGRQPRRAWSTTTGRCSPAGCCRRTTPAPASGRRWRTARARCSCITGWWPTCWWWWPLRVRRRGLALAATWRARPSCWPLARGGAGARPGAAGRSPP